MKSPFTGIKYAKLEVKNMKRNGWKVFSICAIALIPLIYAGLFLLAFLDPYGSLNQVPAAVVNYDKGAEVNGETRNIGTELYDSLIEANENAEEGQASGFDWKKTDEDDASQGLKEGKYYMMVVIPGDFSKNIASADSSDPKKAELNVYFNPSTNLIAQTVGTSMVTKIKAEVDGKVQREYYDNIFLNLTKASDQLLDAVDGSKQLDDGLNSAYDGSKTITINLAKLVDGSATLEDGIAQLVSGTNTLESSSETLSTGAKTLQKSGTSELAKGTKQLQESTSDNSDLATGMSSLASGLKTLINSTKDLPSSTSQLSSGLSTLVNTLVKTFGDEKTNNTLIYGSNSIKGGLAILSDGLDILKKQFCFERRCKQYSNRNSATCRGLKLV